VVGFVDDFMKVFRLRSLGLRAGQKLIGQIWWGPRSATWRCTFLTVTT
jgi:hypothetical protein